MSSSRQVICWVVTSGAAGMENQCLGLAHSLGFKPVIKRVEMCSPWKQLAPTLRLGLSQAFSETGDSLLPPWPDVMIASGRAGAAACLLARKNSGYDGRKKTFTVYIQNPRINPSHFSLVALPLHDGVVGENVVSTRGSLHRVTSELLEKETEKFRASLSLLPAPRIAVLIGGSNSVYRLTPTEMEPLAQQLAALAKDTGGSLMVTTSRRTGEENVKILQKGLQTVPHFLWAGEKPNPYYAFLGLADAVLVTEDSVNMASEACSTGKPVHIIGLEGGSKKFNRFHEVLRRDGLTRSFEGKLETWSYEPLRDVELVATCVREMMAID